MVPSLIMLHLCDRIPHESIVFVREKLKKLDKVNLARIASGLPILRLYNVEMVFWVGSVMLGVFGVGRFMIGDKFIGLCKLTLFFLSILMFTVYGVLLYSIGFWALTLTFLIIACISTICMVAWWILDLFFITQRIKRANLSRVLQLFSDLK